MHVDKRTLTTLIILLALQIHARLVNSLYLRGIYVSSIVDLN